MVISTKKRIRGTKFISLIRLLECFEDLNKSLSQDSWDEFLDETFGNDLEIKSFINFELRFECEIAYMLLDYLCRNVDVINEYFNEKRTLECEYKNIWNKILEDRNLMLDYISKFCEDSILVKQLDSVLSEDNPLYPLLNFASLLTAKMQLDDDFIGKTNNNIELYNVELGNNHFQATIFNNIISIIISSFNAIQANISTCRKKSFLQKLNNSRKIFLLNILNLISTEFNFNVESLINYGLNIDNNELEFSLEEIKVFPNISDIIKQIKKVERQKERLSTPSENKDFYTAKVVNSFDIQMEQVKTFFPIDLESEDDQHYFEFQKAYRDIMKKHYQLL